MNKKLKPVVFVQGKYAYNSQNTSQQIMLLNALKVTQDPKKLRELIGVKTVADVYRTLDKIAMRKEYHAALARSGVTFDYIVENIKTEIDSAEKSSERMAGLKLLLQSIGMDKYQETVVSGGGWEDVILKIQAEKEKEGKVIEVEDYEVLEPEMPEEIRIRKEKEREAGKELYD